MTIYIRERDGSKTYLPPCSNDWTPSVFWSFSCIHDPVGPLCRRHLKFFKIRKAAP